MCGLNTIYNMGLCLPYFGGCPYYYLCFPCFSFLFTCMKTIKIYNKYIEYLIISRSSKCNKQILIDKPITNATFLPFHYAYIVCCCMVQRFNFATNYCHINTSVLTYVISIEYSIHPHNTYLLTLLLV